MNFRKKGSFYLLGITAALTLLGFTGNRLSAEEEEHWQGMLVPSDEAIKNLEKKWPKIVRVRPNKIGVARAQNVDGGNLLSASSADDEILTNWDIDEETASAELMGAVPSYVDNSTLPSFPPIGNQGASGSCVGFCSTYYQATHEIGMMNGYNNKTSNTNILSPKWTYNLINFGKNGGTYVSDAYEVLSLNGATTNVKFPYVASDYLPWDVVLDHWIGAINYRTTGPTYVAGVGGTTQNLTQIKQLLANGHVLGVGTYPDYWKMTTILNNTAAGADNRFVGQKVVSWMSGTGGGHYTTIVGYNDNIWVDVNGNGKVDPGEMGAFLIANSWGPGWGNKGYVWVAYDAFLNKSAVTGGPTSTTRAGFGASLNHKLVSVTGKKANYKPSLIATFTLSAASRTQIGIKGGVSTTSQTQPVTSLPTGAIYYNGGAYNFEGKTGTDTATFALDLSDLVDTTKPSNKRFYVMVSDNTAGNPTQIQSLTLIDYVRGTTTKATGLPVSIDNKTTYLYVDRPDASVTPTPGTSPVVALTAPASNATLTCSVPVAASITSSSATVKSVALYVDGKIVNTDTSAPYTFILDTTKYTNGAHTLAAVATDANNLTGQVQINVQIHNGCD